MSDTSSRRWLAFGAAAGLAAAAVALLAGARTDVGSGWTGNAATDTASRSAAGAVAVVNGVALPAADLERMLAALDADTRAPVGAGERRFVLERLIDEELLLQRALALGLARHDRRIRNDLIAALVESVVADAALREPEPDELRRFYDEHRAWFAPPTQVRIRQLVVRGPPHRSDAEARARAETAHARLRAGEPFAVVAAELGDSTVAPPPSGWMPVERLAAAIGSDAVAALASLEAGESSEPLPLAGGFQILWLEAAERSEPPPLDAIEGELREAWRRRARDEALRRYVASLRDEAEIRIDGALR